MMKPPINPQPVTAEAMADAPPTTVAQAPVLYQPTYYFLTAGCGDATQELVAFDKALLDANVGDVNLVKLSSIVGPQCKRIAAIPLPPGALVPVAYAKATSEQAGQQIASAVAVAHPVEPNRASLVMEHSGVGPKEQIEQKVIEMALEGMAARGLEVAYIESIAVEHVVKTVGATFAAVVEL